MRDLCLNSFLEEGMKKIDLTSLSLCYLSVKLEKNINTSNNFEGIHGDSVYKILRTLVGDKMSVA